MPNYYAHLVFGREVLALLSPDLGERLTGELSAFQVGAWGPDPLFFSQRAVGLKAHHSPVRPLAETLRREVEEGLPFAQSYAAGFLCHYALDHRCHGYIRAEAAQGKLTHGGIETELDRALMTADGFDPLRQSPLPRLDLPRDFFDTAAALYPDVTGAGFRRAVRRFRGVCRLQTRTAGTCLRRPAQRISPLRDVVLSPEPQPAYRQSTAHLLDLLHREAAPTAARLEDFFAGEPLGEWYDGNFEGEALSSAAT